MCSKKKCYLFTACLRLVYAHAEEMPQHSFYKETQKTSIFASVYGGQLTIAMCCCNAIGSFVLLFIIIARKRAQEQLLDRVLQDNKLLVQTVDGSSVNAVFLT